MAYICLVDDAVVASALDGIEVPSSTSKPVDRESQSYQTLCVFLNDCGRAINSAYDRLAHAHPSIGEFVLKPQEKRWYPQLHFHPNDEATADGIDSAAPLKPDIVGLHEKDFNPKALPCCWGFSAAKNPQVRIPVEAKKAWPELIWQAGTYARALRSATPERALRLVFGYNQVTCDFRVLIFHNGGLAASLPCDLRSASGRKDVVRMLWSVFLWQDAEDAGFPSFTDGDQLALYGSENTDYIARRVSILSHSLSCRGRGTLVIKAQLGLLADTRIEVASFIGLKPQTCLDGGPRRTRASTQSKTQASRDRKDQRDAKKTSTLGQQQSGSGGKNPASSELVKSRKPASPQPSSPGSQQSPAPPIPADIPQIRSVKYHEEAVAACVPTEFRTLGAAFAPEDDLETLQTPASRFHTAPDGFNDDPIACRIRDKPDDFFLFTNRFICDGRRLNATGCGQSLQGTDPHILAQLPRQLQVAFPAYISARGAISKLMMRLMCNTFSTRMGPSPFSEMVSEIQYLSHADGELMYTATANFYGQTGLKQYSAFDDCYGYAGSPPSVPWLKGLFTDYMSAHRIYIERDIATKPATVVKADHTFDFLKYVGALKGERIFTTAYTVVNEYEEVRGHSLTESKSLEFVKDMFEGIQQGLKDTDSMVAVHDSNSDVIVHDSNSDVGTIIVSDSDNDNLLDLQYPPSLPSVMPPITLDLCVDVAVAFWAHETPYYQQLPTGPH
ncbi:hypothetical protein B0H10DRAFT_2227628 [Mycena sp. CBHHK59/15]|nr:hypothetical protein B0H10DRAFT_2227628 [Mycena sp. CBHHK59/15]